MKIQRAIIGMATGTIWAIGTCNASDPINCTSLKTAYTNALKAYTGTCNAQFLSQYSGYFISNQLGICNCLANGTSADNCVTIQQMCCITQKSATIGNTELWQIKTWNDSTKQCTSVSAYKCMAGYYGNPTSPNSCSQCPAPGTTDAPTASTSGTTIISCYIPSGISFSDSSGDGTYTNKCYYSAN